MCDLPFSAGMTHAARHISFTARSEPGRKDPETMTDTANSQRQALQFEGDKGAGRARWVAGGLALAIAGWMGSGFIFPAANSEVENTVDAPAPVAVMTLTSTAQDIDRVLRAEGVSLAARETVLRAEGAGPVREVLARRGDALQEGRLIARLDTTTREAELARARAALERAEREFANATELEARGRATADRVVEAAADLAAGRATVALAEQSLGQAEIRAPFSGQLEELDIEAGQIVSPGESLGRMIDVATLTLRIQVPQVDIADIQIGQEAEIAFLTGQTSTGVVRFIARSADAQTRTFEVEIALDNADGQLAVGLSAQVRIITGQDRAHLVSPAYLSLGEDGTLGLKTVGPDNHAAFAPVTILKAEPDGVWVTGLPDQVLIITTGQGFVSDGEEVAVQDTTEEQRP